jgi:hypothetical protein
LTIAGGGKAKIASAWKGGRSTYAVRVRLQDRQTYFNSNWTIIEVELDGEFHEFSLTPGFWNKCPEFCDRGTRVIREWLQRHHALEWPKNEPPQFELIALGGNRFRLLP